MALVFVMSLMEGRHAAGELEGFPAPLSGVLADLSFARDNAHEINPFAAGLAKPPLMKQTRCQIAAKNKMSRQIGGEEVD